ncbi:hypothetical protein I3760_04G073800, partial [Carya illinoinensis]
MKGLSTSSQITSAFYSAKDVETSKSKSIKEEANKDDEDASTLSPTASDMAASIAPLPSQLNVINRNYFEIDLISLFKYYNSKENRDKRKTYHATFSDLEKSRVKRKWKEEMNTKQKHILFFDFLENYYVSKNSLNVLQTDFVKEEGRTTVKSSHPPSEAIIISHLGVDLTASPFKAPNAESNDRETNTVLSETKKIIQQNNFSNTYLQTIGQQLDRIEEKIENPISIQSSKPKKRPIFDPKTKQARTLDQINQMLQKIKTEKSSSKKIFQSQSSYSADKTYEWNIDGMSEQEILNTMSKMSLVANAYINNNIREPDIVHFIGTPSNITNRVSDYLNNLRCRQMSDYRWYQDVFTSRVMLRNDSQKPYWKEKFIDGLPHLFALKVKDELTDISGFLNYDNLTYGDIFSVIKKLGISMCNYQRMLCQQLKNSKKAKYEMGTFCEQYGLPPIAPSRRKPKQFKQFSKPRGGYKRKPRDDFYKKSPNKKSFPKKKNFQNASKGKCFNCGKKGHFADKCTQKPNKFKNKLNALNISVIDQEELFQLMEMKASSSDMSEFSSSDSEYHSETGSSDSPIIKLGCSCTDSCCKPTGKTINVLSKGEEQENLLLTMISQIQDPELKQEYLLKLKKTLTHPESEPPKQRINFQETLERFQKKKPKEVSTQDLQNEVNLVKKEIIELKTEVNKLKDSNSALQQELLCIKIDKQFDHNIPSDDEQPSSSEKNEEKSSENQIALIRHSIPPKWFSRVNIVIAHDFKFSVIAMIDSGSDMNCIQEGLVPSRYYEKSTEKLSAANGSRMKINYELSNAHVCQDNVCFKIPSVLKVKFTFASKVEIDTDKSLKSLLLAKNQHLNSLQQEIKYKKISEHLSNPLLQSKIADFNQRLISDVCSDLPNAFWHRKKHVVSLPYVKDFSEKNIPTKARPIQMNSETLEFCKQEIKDLLAKNIIRPSKSP